ncbi:MAG: hypothetical protein CL862_00750 [Cyanobium sp. NAT70]|nr:hypothetical protein [Cyanobium sp. NAT70]
MTCLSHNNILSGKYYDVQKYKYKADWATYWDETEEAKQYREYEEIAYERCKHLVREWEWLSLIEFQEWAQDFDFQEWAKEWL